jgi:hypothetical protein
MSYPFTPYGQPSLQRPHGCSRGGLPPALGHPLPYASAQYPRNTVLPSGVDVLESRDDNVEDESERTGFEFSTSGERLDAIFCLKKERKTERNKNKRE